MTAAHDYKQAKDEFVDLMRKFGEAVDELVAEGQHKPDMVQVLARMIERHFSHLTGDALEKKVQHILATLTRSDFIDQMNQELAEQKAEREKQEQEAERNRKERVFADGARMVPIPGEKNGWQLISPPGGFPLIPFPEVAVNLLRMDYVDDASLGNILNREMRDAIADLISDLVPPKGLPGRPKMTQEQREAKDREFMRRVGLVEAQVRAGKPYSLAMRRVAKDEGISLTSFKRDLPKKYLAFLINRKL